MFASDSIVDPVITWTLLSLFIFELGGTICRQAFVHEDRINQLSTYLNLFNFENK